MSATDRRPADRFAPGMAVTWEEPAPLRTDPATTPARIHIGTIQALTFDEALVATLDDRGAPTTRWIHRARLEPDPSP